LKIAMTPAAPVFETTFDSPIGEPWPPADDGLWRITDRARGQTEWQLVNEFANQRKDTRPRKAA
jgi:hypothetical protein